MVTITITQSLFDYLRERRQRYAALRQKLQARLDFLEHVNALMETYGDDLPIKEQYDIAEREARLTPDSELELEHAELREWDQELRQQIPHTLTIQ